MKLFTPRNIPIPPVSRPEAIFARPRIRLPGARSRGMTLIEVIVAVSVVLLLALLLLPSGSRAVAKSRRIGSITTMRGIMAAANLYAAEHKGFLPPMASTEWGPSPHTGRPYLYFFEFLSTYYGDNNVSMFVRPGDDLKSQMGGKRLFGNTFGYSYARNAVLPWSRNSIGKKEDIDNSVPLALLEKPSATFLFIETEQNASLGNGSASMIHFDAPDNTGRTIVGFTDGHVEAMTKLELVGAPGETVSSWPAARRLLWFGSSTASSRTYY